MTERSHAPRGFVRRSTGSILRWEWVVTKDGLVPHPDGISINCIDPMDAYGSTVTRFGALWACRHVLQYALKEYDRPVPKPGPWTETTLTGEKVGRPS